MAVIRACVIGIDNVLAIHDTNTEDTPCYSVWFAEKDKKFFQFNKEDKGEGRELLFNNLSIINESGDNSMYYIKFHPGPEACYLSKSPVVCSVPFRLNAVPEQNQYNGFSGHPVYQQQGLPPNLISALERLEKIPALFSEKLEALEKRIADFESIEVEEAPDMLGRITGMLENQALQPMLAPIGNAIGTFLAGILNKNNMQPNALAGIGSQPKKEITDDQLYWDRVQLALDRLAPYCELDKDLSLLADMAEKNNMMFNMLLKQLRS